MGGGGQLHEALRPLREKLAAVVLVVLTVTVAVTAGACCALAILGQLGAIDTAPFGWLIVAGAGAAASRLLASVYARVLESPDRRVFATRLR